MFGVYAMFGDHYARMCLHTLKKQSYFFLFMFIKRVDLENIRSYRQESITFKSGTTLLTGDIGCGKTTILLALEYALFGILRGKTFPGELLRHNAKKGSVTAVFEIQEKEVIITRSLKRSGTNILQGAGNLSVDGVQEDLVATELKARILRLLGYPDSLLSKSTNLFRYTVYTPQEQVKLILHETVEERKDIIRKIFDIDKYKRVGENSAYYLSNSRERIQRLTGQTDDLKTLKEQMSSQERELASLDLRLPPVIAEFEKLKLNREKTEKSLVHLQKEQDNLRKQDQTVKLLERDLANTLSTSRLVKDQLASLQSKDKTELVIVKPVSVERQGKLKDLFLKLREKRDLLSKLEGQQAAEKTRAQNLSSSIHSLTNCPVCKQDVSDSHKSHIDSQQKEILVSVSKKEEKYYLLRVQLNTKETELRKKEEELYEQGKQFARFQEQQKIREAQEKNIKTLEEKSLVHLKKISEFKESLQGATTLFAKLKEIAIDDAPLKEELQILRSAERVKELALQELTTKKTISTNMYKALLEAIRQKETIQKNIDILSGLRNWMSELFVPLVKTVEKKVLLKVYREFNAYFVKWFAMLVHDDGLLVRLDEDFTPVIEQNGFDTSIANLSGGEKTSLALAYRLALNKVLNDYFSSLHTKGLLILDEPTDGFSSEQVDTLRDVLDQSGVLQLIIVSHEQRLESLADNLLRIEKTNQESVVFTN